jgi:two-component system CheB/CheR fusion protein
VILERSIAEHARASAASVDALTAALTGRLDAMARTHTRLSRSDSTELRSLVEEELAPYRSETNACVEGPDLAISPEAARALGMVMHELATNAVKYGALSNDDGQVAVGWQLTGQDASVQLKLVWQETGGPPVAAPKRQGLGTRLIRDLLRHELGGQVELSLPPTGMRCEIEMPLARVSGTGVSARGEAFEVRGGRASGMWREARPATTD